jgi:hypothetical protein
MPQQPPVSTTQSTTSSNRSTSACSTRGGTPSPMRGLGFLVGLVLSCLQLAPREWSRHAP